MSILYSTNSKLIGLEELENRRMVGQLESHDSASTTLQGAPFHPIGIGRPLSVRIYAIYVGDLPPRNKPRKARDVMVVSGLKAAQTFDATPRAVNLIQEDVKDGAHLEFGAFQDGSPIVYYTPALTDDETACSLELVPDTFPGGVVDRVASLFQRAAGLPVFTPASSFLLAGATLTKMFNAFAKKYLEREPTLVDTLTLRFDVAGFPSFSAGIYAIVNDRDKSELLGYEPKLVESSRMALVKDGQPYAGTVPYILVGVDGRDEPQLADFSPHVASAAMLEKFYPSQEEGSAVVIDQLRDAVTLLNDFTYRQRAMNLGQKLAGMDPGDRQYAEFKELLTAYKKNIQTDEFKVSDIT